MHRFFFSLLILFLPTQLGFHMWPDWAMVLGRRVDYLSPTIFLTDILIVLMLSTWFFSRLGAKLSFFTHWAFIGFVALNIFFAASRPVAIYHWLKFIELALLGYYIIKTKPPLSLISYFLSLSVLYSSLIAIGQFLLQHSIGGPFWFLGERTFEINTPGIARVVIGGKEWLRAYGTFPHPNVLGGYLAAISLLAILQSSNVKAQISKIFYKTTILLGIVALVLTFSRSAWIVAGLGIGWVMWKKSKLFTFVLVSCLLFLISISFHQLDESVLVRQQLNTSAISIFKSAPLFGVGLGNFLVALPQFLPSRTIYFLQPVHNIYLLLISEIGPIGIIGLIWLIRKHIKFNWPLVVLLLLGLVDHYPVTVQQGRLLLTLVIAMAVIHPKLD